MVYELGGTIEAADYNQLIADINKIFGTGARDFGYGGNSFGNLPTTVDLSTILKGESVDNQNWLDLRNAIDDCKNHQGTILTDGLPSAVDIEDGDPASFFPRLASSQNLFDITTNRFNNGSPPTIVPALTSVRGIEATTGVGVLPWGSFIQHEFIVTFTDSDEARHFFNSGGKLLISAQRTGGSATIKNASWDNILIPSNTFIFDREAYAGLTSSFTDLRPQISPLGFGVYSVYSALGAYSASNIWTIQGKRDDAQGPNGGNGSIIRISSNFLDGNPNAPDIVDGKFTSSIYEHKFDSVFNIQSPTYQTTIGVSDGPAAPPVAPLVTATLFANTNNYNWFVDAGSPVAAGAYQVTINNGVTIGQSNASAAFEVGDFPPGSTLTIINNGRIQGRGGKGGEASKEGNTNGLVGVKGGDAFKTTLPVTIDNTNGEIWGGGGGGGGGGVGHTFLFDAFENQFVCGPSKNGGNGGGGAGTNIGAPGFADWANTSHGDFGTATTGGAGGTPANGAGVGGHGGDGGGPGLLGEASDPGSANGGPCSPLGSPLPGGAAGNWAVGVSLMTLISGDERGGTTG